MSHEQMMEEVMKNPFPPVQDVQEFSNGLRDLVAILRGGEGREDWVNTAMVIEDAANVIDWFVLRNHDPHGQPPSEGQTFRDDNGDIIATNNFTDASGQEYVAGQLVDDTIYDIGTERIDGKPSTFTGDAGV